MFKFTSYYVDQSLSVATDIAPILLLTV